MKDILPGDWGGLLAGEFDKPYFRRLEDFLREEYAGGEVYPAREDIFAALRETPFAAVKVVIIGQDPYHEPGQAHGLAFSVRAGVPLPPTLKNIFKERQSDLGLPVPRSGDLTAWARGGVLLLNTVLTVRRGEPGSHRGAGWETFTDRVITLINGRETPAVFLLWGRDAGKKAALLTNPRHTALLAAHPSPLSANRGFFGCRHFSLANAALERAGAEPVNWGAERS